MRRSNGELVFLNGLGDSSSVVQRRWVFLAFLAALHLIFLQGPENVPARLIFLSHIGLGLVWQPFVHPRRRLGWWGMSIVFVFAGSSAYLLGWGGLLLWTMLLCGVVGGKIFLFHDRWERRFYLLALIYLASAALALILPAALGHLRIVEPLPANGLQYALPALLVAMAMLPPGDARDENRTEIVDYVYGVLVFLLLAVIVLGSLSFALLFKAGYFESLMMTLAITAGLLLALGLIWDPRAGFGGLGSAVAQHVLSLGLPIEDWLESLATLADAEENPEYFLAAACNEFPKRLPGVAGGRWSFGEVTGEFGARARHRLAFRHGPILIELDVSIDPSPSLRWQYDLVVRLLAEWAIGKWRAQELKRFSYVEAIHETGARLTHDVKNLLQSLDALCIAAEQEQGAPSPRFGALLRRQLPEIAARLRQTLDKLATPEGEAGTESPVPAMAWFDSLQRRYAADWLALTREGDLSGKQIDAPAMMSSVAENLVQNLTEKRKCDAGLRASLRLIADEGGLALEVEDSGMPVPPHVQENLFVQRVVSESGLGIGLYQSARLARRHGWDLRLKNNRHGSVCFRLAPIPPAGFRCCRR